MDSPFVSRFVIYKGKNDFIYDETNPQFNCFRPEYSGNFWVVDCVICDEYGNTHPHYNVKGVPVHVDNIGAPVSDVFVIADAKLDSFGERPGDWQLVSSMDGTTSLLQLKRD